MMTFTAEEIAAFRVRYKREGPYTGQWYVPDDNTESTCMAYFFTETEIRELVEVSPLDAYLAQLGDA